MDVSEYLNIMIMNLFYGNIDFPGNNIVFWRPNDDDTESGLPKIWRFIVKDTDFGLGLYGRQNNYNTIDLLYNPANYPNDNWAFTEPATRLIKNMLEDKDILDLFIDKCCVYMGDFMNGKGTGETIDLIKAESMEEFVAHRDKYNPGWWWPVDNRSEIENKFNAAKQWAEGRPNNFYNHIGKKWNLGTAFPVTINKGVADMPEDVTVNGIKLSEGVFDGKLFPNRQLTITATAPEGKTIAGWKVTTTPASGSKKTENYDGDELVFTPASCKSMSIEAIFSIGSGISEKKAECNDDVKAIYNLRGERQQSLSSGINIVVYGNGEARKVVR